MIEAVKRIRPRRDGSHTYQGYFLYWTAFSSAYTVIAQQAGLRAQLRRAADGTVETTENGSVRIPLVDPVSEREQARLAVSEFSDRLKDRLIAHESTYFFAHRTPFWQGVEIERDFLGQRVNGVVDLGLTVDSEHPVWSPVDLAAYEAYQEDPKDEERRDFLARQIVDLLYTVRANFMQGGKKFDDANDLKVVEHALPLLEMVVRALTVPDYPRARGGRSGRARRTRS